MKTLLLFLTISFSFTAFAQDSEHREGPCITVMDACKTAGYNGVINGEKKSLSKDCIQPLLAGQKVNGVTLDAAIINACKAKKSQVRAGK